MTDVVCPVPWSRFAREVLELYQPPMRRKSTYDRIALVLREFAAYCSSTADLEPLVIGRWLKEAPPRAPRTVESMLRHFQAACAYAVSRGWMLNPFRFRPVSKWLPGDVLAAESEVVKYRSVEEIAAVLDCVDREALGRDWCALRLRAAVYAWAFTGAHKAEILGLRVRDIDLDRRVITIRSHPLRRLKNPYRADVLPIADELAGVLEEWLPLTGCEWAWPHKYRTGPWLTGRAGHSPLDQVHALGERAGIGPGLTILSFRHSFCQHAGPRLIGVHDLMSLMRHSNPRTQRGYIRRDLEQMRAAVRKVTFPRKRE